jgi:hypothetical protein
MNDALINATLKREFEKKKIKTMIIVLDDENKLHIDSHESNKLVLIEESRLKQLENIKEKFLQSLNK